MQVVFGDPTSQWFTPGYADIEPTVRSLVEQFGERVIFTRFVAPQTPVGAWIPYYERWLFALVPASDHLYDLMPSAGHTNQRVVTETTFGKWGADLAAAMGSTAEEPGEMVLVGVSTDCCVISTALAAADAGVHVRVVQDACAGLSDDDHDRAIAAMALYGPLVEIETARDFLSYLAENASA